MQKRNRITALLLILGSLVGPLAISSQSRTVFTRNALSRRDVLSRAALFERTITEAALKEGVDPLILWTIAYNETRFRPWLTSPRGAQGLMQFMPATASRFGLSDPYEPNASIHAATRYVKYLERLFGGRIESVLAAYNSGEGTVLAYLYGRTLLANGKRINPTAKRTPDGIPPYKETIDYVANGRRIYRWLEAQGKFRGLNKRKDLDTGPQANASQKERPEDKGFSEISTMIVLYDPRTGKRSHVSSQGRLQPFDDGAPVIVSPEVRRLPAQKARSTFAGIPP